MNTLFSLLAILSFFGGLIYFGYKASINGMHWFFIMIWVIFGVGAIVGIYWALNDLCLYYFDKPLFSSNSNSSPEKKDKESKYSLKE